MPTLIESLIPVVDSARQIIADIGFRIHKVQTIKLEWINGIGIGTSTNTVIDLIPVPKVLKYTTEQVIQSGGTITGTDLNISKISKRYSLVDLTGGELTKNEEFFWIVDGVYHTVIGWEERPIGWNIRLRRTNRNA